MSRLDDEYLMAVVRNRSGIDSGELDMSVPSERFERQGVVGIEAIRKELAYLDDHCVRTILRLGGVPGLRPPGNENRNLVSDRDRRIEDSEANARECLAIANRYVRYHEEGPEECCTLAQRETARRIRDDIAALSTRGDGI